MHRVLVLAILAGCAPPPMPATPPLAQGECTNDAQCGDHGQWCAPPGTPACGGAVEAAITECPPDRPHPVGEGCRVRCASEPLPSCAEGSECEYGAICRPDAPDHDARGCVRAACAADADCSAGYCMVGRCYDRPGRCQMIPAKGSA